MRDFALYERNGAQDMIDFAAINADRKRIDDIHALSDGPKRRVHYLINRQGKIERACEPFGQRRVVDILTIYWIHVTCQNCKRWREHHQ